MLINQNSPKLRHYEECVIVGTDFCKFDNRESAWAAWFKIGPQHYSLRKTPLERNGKCWLPDCPASVFDTNFINRIEDMKVNKTNESCVQSLLLYKTTCSIFYV